MATGSPNPKVAIEMDGGTALYRTDFYAWARDQAEKLRAWPEHLRPNGIDTENLAEEVEGLARAEARAFESLFRQLFAHLLKITWHPHQTSRRHWGVEVRTFRRDLLEFGDRTSRHSEPTLWARREEVALKAWARELAEFVDRLDADGHADAARAARSATHPTQLPAVLDAELLALDWVPDYRGPTAPISGKPRRRAAKL